VAAAAAAAYAGGDAADHAPLQAALLGNGS
jgi:hypothetical protein